MSIDLKQTLEYLQQAAFDVFATTITSGKKFMLKQKNISVEISKKASWANYFACFWTQKALKTEKPTTFLVCNSLQFLIFCSVIFGKWCEKQKNENRLQRPSQANVFTIAVLNCSSYHFCHLQYWGWLENFQSFLCKHLRFMKAYSFLWRLL